MKKTAGSTIVSVALFVSSMALAQVDTQPPKLPEVNPGLDNPNNPAIPNNNEKGLPPNRIGDAPTPPSTSTTEGRSRCGTLTDTLARRRCLEELQRDKKN